MGRGTAHALRLAGKPAAQDKPAREAGGRAWWRGIERRITPSSRAFGARHLPIWPCGQNGEDQCLGRMPIASYALTCVIRTAPMKSRLPTATPFIRKMS